MDTGALKDFMLQSLTAEIDKGLARERANYQEQESDADKAAWWLGQALQSLRFARQHALDYGCNTTADYILTVLESMEASGKQESILEMLALEAAAEFKDRHL